MLCETFKFLEPKRESCCLGMMCEVRKPKEDQNTQDQKHIQDKSNARQSFKHKKPEPMVVLRCALPSTSDVPSVAIWCMRVSGESFDMPANSRKAIVLDSSSAKWTYSLQDRVPPGPHAPKLSMRRCWRRRLAHLFDQCVRCLFGRAVLVGFFVNLTPCARSTVFPQFRSQGTSQVCSQPLRSPQVPAFVHTFCERFSKTPELSDGYLRS